MEKPNVLKVWCSFILLLLSIMHGPIGATQCISPVQPIKEGIPAQCEGYLFSPDAESEAYKSKETVGLLRSENQILEQRLKLYIDTTQSLSQDITKRDTNEGLYRFVYFGLGVLVTGFIAVNVKK